MPFLFATLWMPVDTGSGVKTYEQNPHFGLKLHRSIIGLKYYVLCTCTCTSETRVGFFSVGIIDYLHFYSDINVQRLNLESNKQRMTGE